LDVLPTDERLSIYYILNQLKNNDEILPFISVQDLLLKLYLINVGQDLRDLSKEGHEVFEEKVAAYILKNYANEVYINACPQCHQLASTPLAHHCKHCGFDWH
jgi:hypothetical protein